MKTFLKGLLLTLGVLAGLLVLVHLVENWRGSRALERWRAASVAAGDPQNLDQLVPSRIPDSENFAAHPLIAAAVAGTSTAGPAAPAVLWERGASRAWQEGRAMDLEAAKAALKVADLRPVLAPFDTPLKALEEAARRPHSRLQATYRLENDDYPVPALLGLRQYARVLGLRAVLALREGHAEAALADIETILRVADHLKQEPRLISHLLRITYVNLAIQPIWEGLRDHRWNDRQLAQLQQTLGGLDLLESWRRTWQAEGLYLQRAMLSMASAPLWPGHGCSATERQGEAGLRTTCLSSSFQRGGCTRT